MSIKDDEFDFTTHRYGRVWELNEALPEEAPLQKVETSGELESSELETSYQFGYRIPFLPDFLLDHTLLEKEPHERLAEHCRRWRQFVAGLWREAGVTFALVYQWNPVLKSASSPQAARHSVGSINIQLLGRVNHKLVSENVSREVALALQTFGFSPQELSPAA